MRTQVVIVRSCSTSVVLSSSERRADTVRFCQNVLDRREVSSEAWAHLAARGDVVVVLGLESVTAYRWQAGVEDSPEAVASR